MLLDVAVCDFFLATVCLRLHCTSSIEASLSSFELSLLFLNSLFGGSSFLPFFVRGLDPVGVSLKVNDL